MAERRSLKDLAKSKAGFVSISDICSILAFFIALPFGILVFFLVFQGIMSSQAAAGVNASFVSEGFNMLAYLLPIVPLIYVCSMIIQALVGRKQRGEDGEFF